MENKKRIVIASGYFNPLHKGHIEYLKKAKQLGDFLVVIVNNDEQVKVKGSFAFMPEDERLAVVRELKYVDDVFLSIDKDHSVIKSIEVIAQKYPGEIIFGKGGDRHAGNIPEKDVCDRLNIKIIDGLGDKIQSSSSLINQFKNHTI